jgi:hypothetical protein
MSQIGKRPLGLPGAGSQWSMSAESQTRVGTSLKSLVKGYLLTHQTEGSSPSTVEFYQGILDRFLWYAENNGWPDDCRLLTEWHIREFLGYVGTEVKRWDVQGNGSESSSRKASPRTIHHYYRALTAVFSGDIQNDAWFKTICQGTNTLKYERF